MKIDRVKKTIIFCDFDGTITKKDTGLATMERYASPEWKKIEQKWKQGEISSMECLQEEFNLIDVGEDEYNKFILTHDVDDYFLKFIKFCKENRIIVRITSDGVDFNIKLILNKIGLKDIKVYANKAFYRNGKVKFEFPYRNLDCNKCGNCKKLHLENVDRRKYNIVYIGDGNSDKCAARIPDILFAKGFLENYCKKNKITSIAFSNFNDIILWLSNNYLKQGETC